MSESEMEFNHIELQRQFDALSQQLKVVGDADKRLELFEEARRLTAMMESLLQSRSHQQQN